jgi:hypothetical protein
VIISVLEFVSDNEPTLGFAPNVPRSTSTEGPDWTNEVFATLVEKLVIDGPTVPDRLDTGVVFSTRQGLGCAELVTIPTQLALAAETYVPIANAVARHRVTDLRIRGAVPLLNPVEY